MKKITPIICFILLIQINVIKAQSFKAQLGISYIEHFTTGIEFNFKNNHSIAINYGSNLFIKPQDFSSFMLQYEYKLSKTKIFHFIPKFGIKGGYSIYTNEYYQWKLLSISPYLGCNYQLNQKFELAFDLGSVFSRELSMKRISYGEVGWYKKILPEIKVSFLYRLYP